MANSSHMSQSEVLSLPRHVVGQITFQGTLTRNDPFNEIELDVVFRADADGREWRVPAFWDGGTHWRVRFALPEEGTYSYHSECSVDDPGLGDQRGRVEVEPYHGENPLLYHGPLQVSARRTHLEHTDGTPFLWLGDTWWMMVSSRLRYPDELAELVQDRLEKGFTLIQLVMGLFPDQDGFDPRGANEGGWAYTENFDRINPRFYQHADAKIDHLLEAGLVPCLLPCWGYYIHWLGVEKMKRHLRYLLARYGAYPIVWCLAGETRMPHYLSTDRAGDVEIAREKWTEVARYFRQINPWPRPLTAHCSAFTGGSDQILEPELLDFDMTQEGHGGMSVALKSAIFAREYVQRTPIQPVINGEVCYEGIMGSARDDVQRFLFWSSMLSGMRGFTYGANGLWQFNRPQQPYGPGPNGSVWGNEPWRSCAAYPGSRQLGLGARLLEQLPWWKLEPHDLSNADTAWVEPMEHHTGTEIWAAGTDDGLRIFYFAEPLVVWRPIELRHLDASRRYRVCFFNPITGDYHEAGTINRASAWRLPKPPVMQDWVVILEPHD